MPYVGKKTTGQYTRVDTLQALELAAKQYGVEIKKDKPSLFRRTVDIISRPLYASANVAEAIIKNTDQDQTNNQNVLQEAWNGLSGKEKTTYSDVLKTVGIENKYARGIVGFALDVALDPTTYIGGGLVKGAGKLIGKTALTTGKVATKLGAGRQVMAIEETAKTIKDALGKGFVFGYGTSKLDDGTRLSDIVMRKTNELGLLKDETVAKYVERFGAKLNQYNKDDVMKAGEILWKNRKLELTAKGGARGKTIIDEIVEVPLAKEARKYKSAEEFVKAQGKPLLHFTEKKNLANIEKNGLRMTSPSDGSISEGISLTTKRTEANEIFGSGEAKVFIDPKAKTITLKDALDKMGFAKETDIGVIKNVETEAPTWAAKNGYDVLDMRDARGAIYQGMDEIRVLNPEVIKTKSQLTDIWNKANATPKTASLEQEARKYKSAEEFVKAQGDIKVDDYLEKKFNGKVLEYDSPTGSGLKQRGIKIGDNIVRYQIFDQNGQIWMPKIFIDKKGSGLGTKFINSLKELADLKGKNLVISSVENPKFFDKFNWLKNERGAYRYETKSQLTDIWNKAKINTTAKVDYIKADSPIIEEILTKLKSSGQEIAKLAKIPEDKIYENYFPGIFEAGKKVGAGGGKGLTTGGQNYLKKYEGKLEYDNAVKSPIEALARTEFEVVRDAHNTAAMLDIIEGFGVSSKKFADDVARGLINPADYVPITKSGKTATSFFKVATKTGKELEAELTKPKILGYLKKADAELVNSTLHPEMKTIDLLAKASGYDAFLNSFKGAVTSLFPAFHARNMASGYVQNYSVLGADAFNPKNIQTGLALSSTKINKQLAFKNFTGTTQELRDLMLKEFKGSTRYIADIGNYIDEMVDGTIRFNNKFNPMNAGRAVGGWIEFNQKANAVATALRQGSTVNEAIRLAEKAGFNYAKVTSFEAKVMRRLIPFYTFARKNAELQLATMAKNPERILNQIKFANGLSTVFGGDKPTQEELAGIPPWALEGLGFKLQDGKFVSRFGLPIEDFISRVNDPIKSSLSSLNPLIKFPIEAKTGYDFFRERQIKDLNQVDEVTAKLLLNEKTPQWLKDAFSVTSYVDKKGKTRYTADAKNLHLLRNLPTSRLQSTVSKLADGDLELQGKMLSFLSGIKIEDINQELQANFREKDLMSAYQDELKRRGAGFDWNMFLLQNEKLLPGAKEDIKAMEKAAREAKKIED